MMLMMSHYELHDDELAWWLSSLSESRRIAQVRHELIAAMRYDQLRCLASALWRCLIVLKCILSVSFQRRSGRPTVLVPIASSPNNNCFGIRSSDMRATYMTSPPELHLPNDHLNIGHASSVKDLIIGDSVGIWDTEDGS